MQVILDGIERHVAEARLGLDADDGRVDFTVAVAVLAVGLGVVAGRWGGRGLRLGRRHRSDRSGDSGRCGSRRSFFRSRRLLAAGGRRFDGVGGGGGVGRLDRSGLAQTGQAALDLQAVAGAQSDALQFAGRLHVQGLAVAAQDHRADTTARKKNQHCHHQVESNRNTYRQVLVLV